MNIGKEQINPHMGDPDNPHTWNVRPKEAMEQQIGGDHYKTLGIQPMELVLKNMGYDAFKGACYVKINKYMIRNKDDEVEQLKKARHVLSMWIEEAEKQRDNS